MSHFVTSSFFQIFWFVLYFFSGSDYEGWNYPLALHSLEQTTTCKLCIRVKLKALHHSSLFITAMKIFKYSNCVFIKALHYI